MALKTICDQGYPLSTCRCHKFHDPLTVLPCTAGHVHRGFPMDAHHNPLPLPDTEKICPRCEERVHADRFRGEVCGFCADILEELDSKEVAR